MQLTRTVQKVDIGPETALLDSEFSITLVLYYCLESCLDPTAACQHNPLEEEHIQRILETTPRTTNLKREHQSIW